MFVVVITPVSGAAIACRTGVADAECWRSLPEAWRNIGNVLTWDTQEGAQAFADMNGGRVTPLAEVFKNVTQVLTPPSKTV